MDASHIQIVCVVKIKKNAAKFSSLLILPLSERKDALFSGSLINRLDYPFVSVVVILKNLLPAMTD